MQRWTIKRTLQYVLKGEFHPFFLNFLIIQSLKCKQSHSEWFDEKGFIVEKCKDSDFFTVVVIRTSGPHDYNTDIDLLFTIQNHQ